MIQLLRLKNLALVEDLRWELGSGLNILTGETGAGKSILIDGLNLLLGQRADKTLIRSGETTCVVEAAIDLVSQDLLPKIQALLESIGAELCEGTQLLLKRSLTISGKNQQLINGSPVTLQSLKQVGDLLVDVHGPHDHQSLLMPEQQLAILDAYGKLQKQRQEYRHIFDELTELQNNIRALQSDDQERERRLDLLRFQVKEIEDSQLQEGEDIRVEREFQIASHSREILQFAQETVHLLHEADGAVLPQLAQIERLLLQWQRLDPKVESIAQLNHTAVASLQELAHEAEALAGHIEMDEGHLQELQERLDFLEKLKRKYGPLFQDVIAFGIKARQELDQLESGASSLEALQAQEQTLQKTLLEKGGGLRASRKKILQPLATQIQQELQYLGFKQAHFDILSTPRSQPARSGLDAVEFLLAPNPGEESRPLRAIASSGEMARVMLAIKTTLAQVDKIPVLIFDEIDANVGGETATAVGQKLKKLGQSHQVICITHLPQVAAQGHHHFSVAKKVHNQRSVAELTLLQGADRHQEIARMLGGQNKKSLALAKSLL